MANAVLLLPAAAGALALAGVAAWRPGLACALLALAIPLTAGMDRGAVVPLLRVNEALLLVVVAGFGVHLLARRRPLAFTGLDLVVLCFCLVNVLVPWAVILLTRAPAEQSDWLVVVGPVQYLAVYLLYSRAEPSARDLRLFLHLCLAASIPVAAVAVAQALDLGGVRDLVSAYYPTAPQPSWDAVYRPASLLGHYSAVGAFGLLNLLLALALAATRHPGFPPWWLALVLAANLLSLVAAQTYAPLLAVPLGAALVLLVVRRLPWWVPGSGAAAAAGAGVLLWSSVSGRIAAQFSGTGGSLLPETLQTRVDYWHDFFVPALVGHQAWLGTGTLIPPEVPRPLVDFVDNGYLWQLFRAGVPGLAALAAMLAAVAGAAWAARRSPDRTQRALGGVCLGAVGSVLILDTTSEYLTFTAVSQEFWMLVGLLAGGALAARSAAAQPVVELVAGAARGRGPRWPAGLERAARLLAPDGVLVRSSLAVVVGFGLARALGFLFQVVAGRSLGPDGYGRLGYALAVANVAAVLLTTAPLGLSRYLARSAGDRRRQEVHLVNWLVVVGLLLGASAVVTAVLAGRVGLGGWMLAGLLANLLGVACLETYREVQRGLGRYTLQSVFYVLANALQLAAIVAAAWLGARSPELFLVVYGLSSVAALAVMAPFSRGLRVRPGALSGRRMAGVLGFVRPLLLQAVFWSVWFNADLILMQHLRSEGETGAYAAAKTIASGFTLVPTALAFVFAPRVAALADREVRGHLARMLAFTAAVTVPLAVAVAALARPLTGGVYGGRYAGAALPLVILMAGMVPYSLKSVLGGLWLGLGHPVVETVSAGLAMVVTLAAAAWLVPRAGAAGAAAAFSAGALAQLLVDGTVTVWAFGGRAPRIAHRSDRDLAREDLAPEAGSRPLLLLTEEPGPRPDPAYEPFVQRLEAELRRSRPALLRATGLTRAVRAAAPGSVVYASRSSLTPPALVRSRLARRRCGGVPLALVAVGAPAGPAVPGWLLRLLAPDLLLVPMDLERDAARALGVPAATLGGGAELAGLLAGLEADRAPDAGPGWAAVLAARVRRAAVDRSGWPRRLLWGANPGYRPRQATTAAVTPVEEPGPAGPAASPPSDSVAVLQAEAGEDVPAAAAALLGLRVAVAGPWLTLSLLDRALLERWPLATLPAGGLRRLSEPARHGLAAYVRQGGTLLVDGLDERSGPALRELAARLDFPAPEVRAAPAAGHLLLPGRRAELGRELAGTSMATACGGRVLTGAAEGEVLAFAGAPGQLAPAVVERRVGRGRVVLSALDPPPGDPAEAVRSERAGGLLLVLLLLRQLYGGACWHAPVQLANCTIDDPALRRGVLGLPYGMLLAQARDHGFHATIATVPRELELAEEAVVRRLRESPEHLSACYHGCDHAGYEFYLTGGSRLRYAARPLAQQRRALWRAVEHGRRFARRRGVELDRVMVFPYGPGPARLFPDLHRLGFVASANYGDKYPLEAAVPAEPDLGLRPADLAWEGFPLLWRRGLADSGYLLDLVLGRPVLLFAHARDLGRDFGPFVERAAVIDRASRGGVRWRSLDEVARHAYLERRDPEGCWRVLMTASEACLHNPDDRPRRVAVERPHRPPGSVARVDGGLLSGDAAGCLEVIVPARATATVRLLAGGPGPALPGRRGCSVFDRPPEEDSR
jgi:O-antigen/teichoic acid export membrane protein